jgi:enoyl-CoA hydratase
VIAAHEALALGIVERVVPDAALADEAQALAAALAARAPIALREAKRATRAAAEALLAPGLRYEVEAFAVAFATEDRIEGLRAFLEKRQPDWKGR